MTKRGRSKRKSKEGIINMDIKEKNTSPLEPTDADYIMFNHNVLSAYRDLLELKI